MEAFKKEVKGLSTQELMLILQDQVDLYSAEELAIIKDELYSRPAFAPSGFESLQEKEERRAKEKEQREKAERLKKEKREKEARERQEAETRRKRKELESKVDALKSKGYDGYFEYTTLTFVDDDGGALSAAMISQTLNKYALEGWRLVSSYSNELGHTSKSAGFGGFSSSTNATIDQHIFILERFIKI